MLVASEVVKERFERLKDVTDRSALRHHQARVGKREEVLVEGPSRRNEQMLSGRTRRAKARLIHSSRHREPAAGGIALASVDVTYGAPYYLLGELHEVLRAPRHKIRVPLLSS